MKKIISTALFTFLIFGNLSSTTLAAKNFKIETLQKTMPIISMEKDFRMGMKDEKICQPNLSASGFQDFAYSTKKTTDIRTHVQLMEENNFLLPNGEHTTDLEDIFGYVKLEYSNDRSICETNPENTAMECGEMFLDENIDLLNELLTEAVNHQCEVQPFVFGFSGGDEMYHDLIPTLNDADEDGIPDYFEIRRNLDPCSPQTFICGKKDGARDIINRNGTPDREDDWQEHIDFILESGRTFSSNNF